MKLLKGLVKSMWQCPSIQLIVRGRAKKMVWVATPSTILGLFKHGVEQIRLATRQPILIFP